MLVSIKDSNGVDVSNDPSNIGNINPYRYRGYRYDNETQMYYLQSRYYNPELGRFINTDNLINNPSTLLSMNLFAYCKNNPVNTYDPDGHFAEFIATLTIFGGGNSWNPIGWTILGCVGAVLIGVGIYYGVNAIINSYSQPSTPAPSTSTSSSVSSGSSTPANPEPPNNNNNNKNNNKTKTNNKTQSIPKDGMKVKTNDALKMAEDYLGKGYKEFQIGKFRSSDGLRQVRMTNGDILGQHMGKPHMNFDILSPKYKTIHIFLE